MRLKNTSKEALKSMGATEAAQFSFTVIGSNENPYHPETEKSDWEQYEQHFDTLIAEENYGNV